MDDTYKLKPIDVKDTENPDMYDNNTAKFTIRYERFWVLFENRHPNWGTCSTPLKRLGR